MSDLSPEEKGHSAPPAVILCVTLSSTVSHAVIKGKDEKLSFPTELCCFSPASDSHVLWGWQIIFSAS